jgi:hypothetical protein
MSKTLESLADLPQPLEALPLLLSADRGPKVAGPGTRPIAFGFEYLGLRFLAEVKFFTGRPYLRLSAPVAPLPYSAESAFARRCVIELLHAARAMRHGRFILSPAHHIVVSGEARLEGAVTPASLIAATAHIVFELKPYLELLAAMVEPWRQQDRPH